jgi:hypothetical protein
MDSEDSEDSDFELDFVSQAGAKTQSKIYILKQCRSSKQNYYQFISGFFRISERKILQANIFFSSVKKACYEKSNDEGHKA